MRACYAALRMQASVRRYSEELRRAQGVEVQIRVGLNSGEVVVRSIGSDLRMDYTAVGQTTDLAARMEQLAAPGSIRLTADTLRLAEGFVQVTLLGPCRSRGSPSRSRCSSGGGRRRPHPLRAAARAGAYALCRPGVWNWSSSGTPSIGRAWGTARWSPWSGSRAWASCVSSGSSLTPTACTAGSSCNPPRSPTAMPPPTCR